MIEWRCNAETARGRCTRILMRLAIGLDLGAIEIEIVCPKCGTIRRRRIAAKAVA